MHGDGFVRRLRRPFIRCTTYLGPRVLPQGEQIVFVSAHSDDPDALVILEFLARHSDRPLVWMAPEPPQTALLDEDVRHRVRAYRYRHVAGVFAFLSSSLVFHTYGMLGVKRASSRQTVINVWHGDGPKRMRPAPMATTYMVAGIREFGTRRMDILRLPRERLLVAGRPRVDDLYQGLSEDERIAAQEQLGLDHRPIIWWLPTWREAATFPTTLDDDLDAYFAPEVFTGLSQEYQWVVKPHANSPRQDWPAPWQVLDSAAIRRSGVRWYRLLGSAAAILTDYSSIWADFLHTSVPLGFITPDRARYAEERGFYMSNWQELLPGPLLHNAADVRSFLMRLRAPVDEERRSQLAVTLGSANEAGATRRLFSALDAERVSWR